MSNADKNYDPEIAAQDNANEISVVGENLAENNEPDYEADREIPDLNEREHSQGKKAIFWGIIFLLFIAVFIGVAVFAKNFGEYRKQQKEAKAEVAEKNKDQADFASDKIDKDKNNFVAYPEPTGLDDSTLATANNGIDPNSPTNANAVNVPSDSNYVSPQPNYQQPTYNATGSTAPTYGASTASYSANNSTPTETPLSRKMGNELMYSGTTGKASANDATTNSGVASLADMQGQGFIPQENGGVSSNGNSSFSKQYQSTTFAATQAKQRNNLSLLLRQGTMIPCVLKTKIVSTFAGQTACQVTKDIYSANGKTLLIERGSNVIGEQTVKVEQGQARVFVLWSKLDTPKGVSLTLDSGASDNLGASGINAKIDNHWWKRFGSAILLSVIEDGLQAVASQSSNDTQNGGVSYNSSSNATKEMAKVALENSINIPPTATINQGTLLNIFVARDIDFQGVYELASK